MFFFEFHLFLLLQTLRLPAFTIPAAQYNVLSPLLFLGSTRMTFSLSEDEKKTNAEKRIRA
jgi:hypothetical protein